MKEKSNGKSKEPVENPEFENVKTAFRQLLSIPKEKIDEIEKRQSKPPQKPKQQNCK